MHSLGLQGKRSKENYHSFKGEVGKAKPNIIDRDFTATAPLQKQTTDVYQFTIVVNYDSTLFIGGKEKRTLEDSPERLGKEPIYLYNISENTI